MAFRDILKMKDIQKIIEQATDKAIESFKNEVESTRGAIIRQLKKKSAHKAQATIEMDAYFFLEKEFRIKQNCFCDNY